MPRIERSLKINSLLMLVLFKKNIPFDEWFKVVPLKEYHRVILAEEFMRDLAPEHWPPGKRKGWCYSHSGDMSNCDMKIGQYDFSKFCYPGIKIKISITRV